MNKAVVEFYKSGQTTTGLLKQTLMSMKNQVTKPSSFHRFNPCLQSTQSLAYFLCFRFTRQQKMLMVWMMLKIVSCTTIKLSSTITCGSSLMRSASEKSSTSFWNRLVCRANFHAFNWQGCCKASAPGCDVVSCRFSSL